MNKLKSFKERISIEMKKRQIRIFDIIACIFVWTAFSMLLYNVINYPYLFKDKTETIVLMVLSLFFTIMSTVLILWIPKNNKENNDHDIGTK